MATLEITRWKDAIATRPELAMAFVAGTYVEALSGDRLACVSPVSGETLVEFAACDGDDVDRAVAAARGAFEDRVWSDLAPQQRKRVLLDFAQRLLDHRDELAALITIDVGKPIAASEREVCASAEGLRRCAEALGHAYGAAAPLGPAATGTITREPVGVVAAITPCTLPLLLPSWKLGPALAAGNSVLLKPARLAPLVAARLGALATEAGIPAGAFNVLPGTGQVAGQALARHEDVDAIAFAGSAGAGRLVMGAVAESNLKKVALELGGSSTYLVLADARGLGAIAERAALGMVRNAGRAGGAGSRLIVAEPVAEELVARVVEAVAKRQPADPFDPRTEIGSMADEVLLRRVLTQIEMGRAEGATVELGGSPALEHTGGFYLQPTVFRDVQPTMRHAREEIAGPVLSVIACADEEQALAIANDSPHARSVSVWTRDVTKAHRMARRLRATSVWVNGDAGSEVVQWPGDTDFELCTREKLTVVDTAG